MQAEWVSKGCEWSILIKINTIAILRVNKRIQRMF